MKKFLTPGIVVGVLTLASAVAKAAGYPLAGMILSDPALTDAATNLVIGLGAVAAGGLAGVAAKAA